MGRRVRRFLSVIIILWSAVYISHLLDYMNFIIAPFQEQAIFLGLILTLTFLSYPAIKGRRGVKWFDWLCIVAGLIPNTYVVFFYDQWQIHGGMGIKTYEIGLCGLLILSLLEGLRRTLGKILPILLICINA